MVIATPSRDEGGGGEGGEGLSSGLVLVLLSIKECLCEESIGNYKPKT